MFPRAQTACSLMCNIGEDSKAIKAGTAPCSTTWDRNSGWAFSSSQARFRGQLMPHLLCVPGCPRSYVCKGPSCFELQRGLIIHRQEGHKAGQQAGFYDLLQRRVTFLREQLPETTPNTGSSHCHLQVSAHDDTSLKSSLPPVSGPEIFAHLAAWQPRVWDSLQSEVTSLIMSSMVKDATYRTNHRAVESWSSLGELGGCLWDWPAL